MFVCVYSVFVLSCVGSGFATGWSLVQGVLPKLSISVRWRNPIRGGLGPIGLLSAEEEEDELNRLQGLLDGWEGIRREEFLAIFRYYHGIWLGNLGKSVEKCYSAYTATKPRIEVGVSRIWIRNSNHSSLKLGTFLRRYWWFRLCRFNQKSLMTFHKNKRIMSLHFMTYCVPH
jgi:hypothetical protein